MALRAGWDAEPVARNPAAVDWVRLVQVASAGDRLAPAARRAVLVKQANRPAEKGARLVARAPAGQVPVKPDPDAEPAGREAVMVGRALSLVAPQCLADPVGVPA